MQNRKLPEWIKIRKAQGCVGDLTVEWESADEQQRDRDIPDTKVYLENLMKENGYGKQTA